LTRPIRVANALVNAASAFLSTLAKRAPAPAPEPPSVRDPEAPRTPLSASLPSSAGVENRCPVCQARFRGARLCSRCGADLEPLMRLSGNAWQLRQAARQALDAGDMERALALAIDAQGLQSTGSGEALRLLCAWLQTAGVSSKCENAYCGQAFATSTKPSAISQNFN